MSQLGANLVLYSAAVVSHCVTLLGTNYITTFSLYAVSGKSIKDLGSFCFLLHLYVFDITIVTGCMIC